MKSLRRILLVVLLATSGCGSSSPLVTRARIEIQDLEKAVETYEVQKGSLPGDLETLTEPTTPGAKAPIAAGHLNDPWHHPYHYDPAERHPNTGRPLIWSDGPSPGQPGSKIANWEVKEGDS